MSASTLRPNAEQPASPSSKPPISSSHPLSLSPHTTLHIRITPLSNCNLISITTTDPATSTSLSALGSLVYALPIRLSPQAPPLSTPLYALPSSVDFATRTAKTIAKRTSRPTYVGCSVALPQGASVEEEVEAAKVAVEGILALMKRADGGVGVPLPQRGELETMEGMAARAPGELDLEKLLATLTVKVEPETFVFITFSLGQSPPNGLFQQMSFREKEGLAVITTLHSAQKHGIKDYTYPSRMITCEVQSSLEAVGFMARIAQCLAEQKISVNGVAAYYHDYLFVPEGREKQAVAALEGMVERVKGDCGRNE